VHPPEHFGDPFGPDLAAEPWRKERAWIMALVAFGLLCFFAPLGAAFALLAATAASEDARVLRASSADERSLRRVHRARAAACAALAIGAACVVVQVVEVAVDGSSVREGG
jgi:hypothetical protein